MSVGLESDHQAQNLDGVTVLGTAQFERADGSTGTVGDVVFDYEASQATEEEAVAEDVAIGETALEAAVQPDAELETLPAGEAADVA